MAISAQTAALGSSASSCACCELQTGNEAVVVVVVVAAADVAAAVDERSCRPAASTEMFDQVQCRSSEIHGGCGQVCRSGSGPQDRVPNDRSFVRQHVPAPRSAGESRA